MARRLGDRATLAGALVTYLNALDRPEHAAERAALTAELASLAEAEGTVELRLGAHERRLIDALERGDLAAVDEALAAYARLAEPLRQPLYLSNVAFWRSMRARMEGRLAEAEDLSRAALAHAQRAGRPDALILFSSQMMDLRRMQGRLAELEGGLRGFVEQFPAMPAYRYALAGLYAELDRPDDVRRELDRLAAREFRDLRPTPIQPFLLSLVARASAAIGDRPRAALLYPLLLPYRERAALGPQATSYQDAVAHPLALLAALLGRDEQAIAHFEAALAFNARMDARPFAAQTAADYAAFLLSRDASAERTRMLLQQALSTAEELGMARLAGQARERLAVLDTGGRVGHAPQAPRRPERPAGLSEREIEVLQLVAAGQTNAEIAAALVLTVNTVQNHLHNIYTKIDARGRTEATAFAYRHGLAAPPSPPPS